MEKAVVGIEVHVIAPCSGWALRPKTKAGKALSSVIVAIFILGVLLSFMISFYLIMNEFGDAMSNAIHAMSREAERSNERLDILGAYPTPSGIVVKVMNNGSRDALIKLAYVRDASTGKYVTARLDALLRPRSESYLTIEGSFNPGRKYVIALITNRGNVFKHVAFLRDYVTFIKIKNRVAESLEEYQVRITLNSTWSGWGHASNDGSDIYFTDTYGKPLYYWVESFSPTQKKAILWVKVPEIPPLGEAVILLHYGGTNLYAPYYRSPYHTFFIFVNLSQWVVGNLAGNGTAYYHINGILQLTDNQGSKLGYLYFPNAPSHPVGFVANITFRAYGGTGADAVWIGAYDTSYNCTREDVVNGGYHFTFDEYQDRIAFTNSTIDNGAPIAYATVHNIDNGVWHDASVVFWYDPLTRGASALIYYDGRLKVNASVEVAYSQLNVMLGRGEFIIGGRTGGAWNYHELTGLIVVRKYVRPEPVVTITDLP